MKKLLAIVLTGFLFNTAVQAQVTRQSNPSQKVRSDSFHNRNNDLNLTQEQKDKLKTLRESNRQQRESIRNDANLSTEQKQQKMKELRQSGSVSMNAILTPEQQQRRKAFMEKNKRHQWKGHSSKARLTDSTRNFRKGRMEADLDLSPDQKTQLQSLRQANQQQREVVQKDASLTADQKKQKMKELFRAQGDQLNSILTPEQQAKRKAFIEKRKQSRGLHGKNQAPAKA